MCMVYAETHFWKLSVILTCKSTRTESCRNVTENRGFATAFALVIQGFETVKHKHTKNML